MPPQTVPEESYGSFSAAIHGLGVPARVPLNGAIEVTHRCPLECRHCYNNLPMGDGEARRRELTLQEHIRILDELQDAGCLWLLYTGGEIFARPDFLEIYRAARARGFLITLFTNGILVTERIADVLAETRPFSIEITLYGRTQATYEALTGIPGSHARCYRAVDLLLERGLPLKLKTVAVSINRHEVGAMRAYAQELGVPFKFDASMNPRIDCSQAPLAVRLRPEEVVAFDLAEPSRVAEWRRFAAEFQRPVHPAGREDRLYHCGGGLDAFSIDPYGGLSICVLSQQDKYDLRDGTFQEGWSGFLEAVRSRKARRTTKCTRCHLKAMCGMCPATAALENGDPEEPVDFLCRVAHLRAMALDLGVPEHGDCEYCAGGTAYDEMQVALQNLRRETKVNAGPTWLPMLPMLPAESGCGSGCASGCSRTTSPINSL